MAQCGWCGRMTMIRGVDGQGLCRECQVEVRQKFDSVRSRIAEEEKLLAATVPVSERLARYRRIAEMAEELLPYEEKGLATIDPPPSRIVQNAINRHDRLIIEQDPDALRDTLVRVREELKPYRHLSAVAKALMRLKEAQKLVGTIKKQSVIAVINQKGGVGKTTSTANIAAGLHMLGKRVLAIDFDPQANLTEAMGIQGDDCERTIFDVLTGDCELGDVIIECDGISVAPANVLLARADQILANRPNKLHLLRSALFEQDQYDYIIIDCLPSLGLLSINALMAANELFVPMLPEYFALSGVRKLMDAIAFVEDEARHQVHISTIIFSRFSNRKKHHKAVIGKIREFFGDGIDYFYIRESIALAEALSEGTSIFRYQPLSHGAVDYFLVCRELVRRTNGASLSDEADTIEPVQAIELMLTGSAAASAEEDSGPQPLAPSP